MRSKTLEAEGKSRKAISFNVRYADYRTDYRPESMETATFTPSSWRSPLCEFHIWRSGQRLVVGTLDVYSYHGDTEFDEGRSLEAGPKTLARIIEQALEVGPGRSRPVRSDYGDELQFVRKGAYVIFRAPCGQIARVTVAELERVLQALPELTTKA